MNGPKTWEEWKAKFISVINNPVYDTTANHHVQEYYQGMMNKLKIKPIHLAHLIALYYDYRPGRAMPRFPIIPNNRFKAVIPSERLAPLQFLTSGEIVGFLNRDPMAKAEYTTIDSDAFWKLKVEQDFAPARTKWSHFKRCNEPSKPVTVYLMFIRTAKLVGFDQLVEGFPKGYNFWKRSDREDSLNLLMRLFSRASKHSLQLCSLGVEPGDIVYFSEYGVGAIWDGYELHTVYGIEAGDDTIPEWVTFPDYPFNHYEFVKPRWPSLRTDVFLSNESVQEAFYNWDEATQTTVVTGLLDAYLLEIAPEEKANLAIRGIESWLTYPLQDRRRVRHENGRYFIL